MIVKNIIKTCTACPSQWEGHLEDGRMFYARYRYGYLTIEISKEPTNDVEKAMLDDANLIYNKQLGDDFDGTMESETLIEKMRECGFTFNKNIKNE